MHSDNEFWLNNAVVLYIVVFLYKIKWYPQYEYKDIYITYGIYHYV